MSHSLLLCTTLLALLVSRVDAQQSSERTAAQSADKTVAQSADQLARVAWPVERSRQADEIWTVFRTSLAANLFALPTPWVPERMGPRLDGVGVHLQRLADVTPEEFRGSVIYPASVDILAGIKAAMRRWQEEEARERIQNEVAPADRK